MESLFGRHPLNYPLKTLSEGMAAKMFSAGTDEVIQEAVTAGNTGRFITINGFYADRHLR